MTVDEYNQSVDLFSDRVYRFILKNLRDEEKARDLVQDCYEKLWRNVENVNFQKVKSYLFSMAYHTMIDLIRKEKRMSIMEDHQLPEDIHFEQYSDIGEVLDKALSYLPEIQRLVVLLRDYEGYSYDEIAKIASLTESQVKVYIYRGRVFLKNMIGKIDVLV